MASDVTAGNVLEITNTRLARCFSNDIEIIEELYGSDPVLTEICTDYLGLCALKPETSGVSIHLSETLSGLEDEIARHLERIKKIRANGTGGA